MQELSIVLEGRRLEMKGPKGRKLLLNSSIITPARGRKKCVDERS
jgi:hypothetical protein